MSEDEYAVEKLLKKRTRKGVVQYEVKWQGFACVGTRVGLPPVTCTTSTARLRRN